ncbi:dihydrolipoamide acetyltransferase family protein [Streptomyces xiaopingdaonensis]|uniref:dihydrolipoamide acetyltransferase family protein n=1 Tax=Streptomyces xiaopingdaonensis TaxID=1565415 RepID=UPI0004945C63|nr:dihydrolipoamide acetyltransferase family protein [Streptomyces xiaopingdaonensis]
MTVTSTAAEASPRIREFRMPDVGEGLTEAEILSWHVQPGDTVADGQIVCEVETAKAAVELPIPFDGQVAEVRFEEGATVDVGTPIITVDTDPSAGPEPAAEPAAEPAPEPEAEGGERQPVLVGYGVSQSATTRRPRKPQANGQAPAAEPQPQPPAPEPQPAPPQQQAAGERPLAKPPVRKLAKDLGVDLAAVAPTGPDGVVTREDVHAAAETRRTAAEPQPEPEQPRSAAPEAALPPQPSERETRVPVRGVRKATAQAMVGSAFSAPHVTEFVTVDVTRTVKLVRELKEDPDLAGVRVNPLLFVAKAFLLAIRRHPEVNASWDEERQEIVRKHYVNLGIAAATPRGLLVPNIKDAHAKTLPELGGAIAELVTTAREGRTTPEAMQGGTVTITNVGVFGVDTGTPILNPGESAILAFGQIKEQPWVHKGKVKPRHVTTLALSFDHRLVDGELGSRVLADTAAVLERPKRLMTWS